MAETNRKGQKRQLIEISSSSEEETSEDDYITQEITSLTSSEDENDESEWNESDDECSSDNNDDVDNLDDDDEESMCTRVFHLLQDRTDLLDLSVKECKAYLRKNGLRLSGTKLECIRRIKEHWRLKDGNCEAVYPRSSFTIDCTGDVCKGDVVLFTQKVYKNFDKVTRSGSILGKRTIAGRIVKESYGAAKQQHTFTVEVLWSKGVKKIPPLFPLLVKGRNLYRLKTFRQHWENEEERLRVLDEKHKRGAAARSVRATRKMEAAKGMNAKASRKKGGAKRQKHSHHPRQHQKTEFGKENCVNQRASAWKRTPSYYYEKPHQRHLHSKGTREARVWTSHRHQMLIHPNNFRETSFRPHPYPPPNFYRASSSEIHPLRAPNYFPPILDSAYCNPHSVPYGMPVEHQEFSYQRGASSNFAFGGPSRNFHHFSSP